MQPIDRTWEDGSGLRCLVSPRRPIVELIFLNGQTGGQLSTWTAETFREPWLISMLGSDIPDARIWVHGSDGHTHYLRSGVRSSIASDSLSLAETVNRTCKEGLPLIFIAHSLGGYTCKEMILQTARTRGPEQAIYKRTKGLMFFGMPCGSQEAASWLELGRNVLKVINMGKYYNLFSDYPPDPDSIRSIHEDFDTFLQSHPAFSVMNYGEMLPHNSRGESLHVVPPKFLATGSGSITMLNKGHVSMTKFSERDADYRQVKTCLQGWVKKLELEDSNIRSELAVNLLYERLERDKAVDRWFEKLKHVDTFIEADRKSNDKKIKIAVLDSGYSGSESIPIHRTGDWTDTGIQDSIGHGTYVAELIHKVAANSEVYVGKVMNSFDATDDTATKLAEVQLINISAGFLNSTVALERAIETAIDAKVLIFAAVSNDGSQSGRKGIAYPAREYGVFGIGSANGFGNKSESTPPTDDEKIYFSAPGEGILCTWAGDTPRQSGSSYATPIATGIAALILEFGAQRTRKIVRKEKLSSYKGMLSIFKAMSSRRNDGENDYRFLAPWMLLSTTYSLSRTEREVEQSVEDILLDRR